MLKSVVSNLKYQQAIYTSVLWVKHFLLFLLMSINRLIFVDIMICELHTYLTDYVYCTYPKTPIVTNTTNDYLISNRRLIIIY